MSAGLSSLGIGQVENLKQAQSEYSSCFRVGGGVAFLFLRSSRRFLIRGLFASWGAGWHWMRGGRPVALDAARHAPGHPWGSSVQRPCAPTVVQRFPGQPARVGECRPSFGGGKKVAR